MHIQSHFVTPHLVSFRVAASSEDAELPTTPDPGPATFEPSPSPEFPPNDHLVRIIEEGLNNREVVQIDYVKKDGYYVANQDLEPIKIKKKTGAGHVILKAYCRNQEGIRHYRMERILDAHKTGETYEQREVEKPKKKAQEATNAPDLLTVFEEDHPLTESGLKDAMVREGIKLAGEVIKEQLVS